MKRSKTGILIVTIYVLLITYFVYDGLTCSGMFCDLAITFPVMPWPLLLEQFSWISDGIITYWVLVLLNIIILYFIGFGIGKLVGNFRKK